MGREIDPGGWIGKRVVELGSWIGRWRSLGPHHPWTPMPCFLWLFGLVVFEKEWEREREREREIKGGNGVWRNAWDKERVSYWIDSGEYNGGVRWGVGAPT